MPDQLADAKRRERISHAEWRRRRAEVARIVAGEEEEAARQALRRAGIVAEPARELLTPAEPAAAPVRAPAPPTASAALPTVSAAPAVAVPTRPRAEAPTVGAARPASRAAPPRTAKPRRATQRRHPRLRSARDRATWAGWLEERPPWAISVAAHGVAMLVGGLLSFATIGPPAFSLTAALGEDASWEEAIAEVTLDTALDGPAAETPDTLSEVPLDSPVSTLDLASLVTPASFESLADSGAFAALSAESVLAAAGAPAPGGGEGAAGGGGSGVGTGKSSGPAGRVSFFGAESQATRVVFVVDNSGSMQNGRMETTLFELERAVHGLSGGQEFYVAFFSDQAYPMFFPDGADGPIPATPENKRRLSAWLHTVEICLGGRLLDAMDLAAGLEPDVVYLLTDGDIRSPNVASRMTADGAWGFPIHTLGMGARTVLHAQTLDAIARNSGGEFRPVAANPQAVARSRVRPLPYHRSPGKVWGSAVQAWD